MDEKQSPKMGSFIWFILENRINPILANRNEMISKRIDINTTDLMALVKQIIIILSSTKCERSRRFRKIRKTRMNLIKLIILFCLIKILWLKTKIASMIWQKEVSWQIKNSNIFQGDFQNVLTSISSLATISRKKIMVTNIWKLANNLSSPLEFSASFS